MKIMVINKENQIEILHHKNELFFKIFIVVSTSTMVAGFFLGLIWSSVNTKIYLSSAILFTGLILGVYATLIYFMGIRTWRDARDKIIRIDENNKIHINELSFAKNRVEKLLMKAVTNRYGRNPRYYFSILIDGKRRYLAIDVDKEYSDGLKKAIEDLLKMKFE